MPPPQSPVLGARDGFNTFEETCNAQRKITSGDCGVKACRGGFRPRARLNVFTSGCLRMGGRGSEVGG